VPEYRRKLPHFHPGNTCLFITWRLAGSVPGKPGPVWLMDSRIADLVARAILAGERERHFYELYGWAVMPNHVHLLIFMAEGIHSETCKSGAGAHRTAILAG
jgi:hypothetical protein